MITHLCDKHYRSLQKKLNPENYQWKCVVCSTGIRGSNYSNFRACSEPELFQKHLVDHTDFQGTITVSDKLCAACYRHSLTISKITREAQQNHTMQLAPLHSHGWTRDTDGHLDILYWDTEENRYKVKSRVDLLMKGCSCKSGCVTNRCGCRKNGETCGPGCRCVNCKNTDKSQQTERVVERQNTKENQQTERIAEMQDAHYDTLQDDISVIMHNVFGPPGYLGGSDCSDLSSEDSEGGSSDESECGSSDDLEGPSPDID